MPRRVLLSLLALCLLGLILAPAVQAQEPRGRLIVENRSPADVDVYVWRYNGAAWEWTFLTRVAPRYGTPISDVREKDRFRAWVHSRGEHEYHTARFDGGSAEDRWPISELPASP